MSFFLNLQRAIKNDLNEKIVNGMADSYKKISTLSYIDQNELKLIEDKCIEYVELACKIEDDNLFALSLLLLVEYYQRRAKLSSSKFFTSSAPPEEYEFYLRSLYLINASWSCIKDKKISHDPNFLVSFKDSQFEIIANFLRKIAHANQIKNFKTKIGEIYTDLEDKRKKYEKEMSEDDKDIFRIYDETTKLHNGYVKKLFELSMAAVCDDPKSLNYAICSMGSSSRMETTLWSDIEFFILIMNNAFKEKTKVTIYAAVQLMQLLVISFNESLIPKNLFFYNHANKKFAFLMQKLLKIKIKRGFAFDGAGRTALGDREIYGEGAINYKAKLIGDVGSIIKYMIDERRLDYKAKCEFSQFTVVKADESGQLVSEYAKSLGRYIFEKRFDFAASISKKVALPNIKSLKNEKDTIMPISMLHFGDEYQKMFESIPFLVKHHLYRPLERLGDAFWLIFGFEKYYKMVGDNSGDDDESKELFTIEVKTKNKKSMYFSVTFHSQTSSKVAKSITGMIENPEYVDNPTFINIEFDSPIYSKIKYEESFDKINLLRKDRKELARHLFKKYNQLSFFALFNLSTKKKIELLMGEGFLGNNVAMTFINHLSVILKLRIDLYSHYQGAVEDLVVPESVKTDKSPLYVIIHHNLIKEYELGKLLVFIHSGYFFAKRKVARVKILGSIKGEGKGKEEKEENNEIEKNLQIREFSTLGDQEFDKVKNMLAKGTISADDEDEMRGLCENAISCYETHLELTKTAAFEIYGKIIACFIILKKIENALLLLEKIKPTEKEPQKISLFYAFAFLARTMIMTQDVKKDLLESKAHATGSLDQIKKKLGINFINDDIDNFNFSKSDTSGDLLLALFFISLINTKEKYLTSVNFNSKDIAFFNVIDDKIEEEIIKKEDEVVLKKISKINHVFFKVYSDEAKYVLFITDIFRYLSGNNRENGLEGVERLNANLNLIFKHRNTNKSNTRLSKENKRLDREEETKQLKSMLVNKNLILIYGDPAVGKTYFVKDVLYKFYAESHKIIWINASTRSSISSSYVSLSAFIRQISSFNTFSIDDLTRKLFLQLIQVKSAHDKPLIIIYDNVSSLDEIKEFIPNQFQQQENPLNRYIVISRGRHFNFPDAIELKRFLSFGDIKLLPIPQLILEKGSIDGREIDNIPNTEADWLCLLSLLDNECLQEFLVVDEQNIKNLLREGYIEKRIHEDKKYYTIHACVVQFLKENEWKNRIKKILPMLADLILDLYNKNITEFSVQQALITHLNFACHNLKEFMVHQNDNKMDLVKPYSIIVSILSWLSHNIYGCDEKDLEILEMALSLYEKEFTEVKLSNIKDKQLESPDAASILRENNLREISKKDIDLIRKIKLVSRVIGFIYLNKNEVLLSRLYLNDVLFLENYLIIVEKILDEGKATQSNEENYSLAVAYRDTSQSLYHAGLYSRALYYAEKAQSYLEKSYTKRKMESYSLENAICISVMSECYYEMGMYDRARQYAEKALFKKNKIFGIVDENQKKNITESATTHYEIAIGKINYATVLCALGSDRTAKNILKEACQFVEKKLGIDSNILIEGSNRIAITYFSLALRLFENHSYDSGKSFYENNENISKFDYYLNEALQKCNFIVKYYDNSNRYDLVYVNTLLLLVEITIFQYLIKQRNLSDLENCIIYLSKAFEVGIRIVGKTGLSHAVAWHNFPRLYFPRNLFYITADLRAHKEFFVKLFYLTKSIYGETHIACARRCYELGRVYFDDSSVRIKFFMSANEIIKDYSQLNSEMILDENIRIIIRTLQENEHVKLDKISSKDNSISTTHSTAQAIFPELAEREELIDILNMPSNFMIDLTALNDLPILSPGEAKKLKDEKKRFYLKRQSGDKLFYQVDEGKEIKVEYDDVFSMSDSIVNSIIYIELNGKWYLVTSKEKISSVEMALSKKMFQTDQEHRFHILALNELGKAHLKSGEHHQAILYFHRLLSIINDHSDFNEDNILMFVNTMANISNAWHYLGFNSRAWIYVIGMFIVKNNAGLLFNMGANGKPNFNLKSVIGSLHFKRYLARLFTKSGFSSVAIDILEKEKDDDICQYELYKIHRNQGKNTDTQKMIKVSDDKGRGIMVNAYTCSLLGIIYFDRYLSEKKTVDYETSRLYQYKALAILKNCDNPLRHTLFYIRLSYLYFSNGCYEPALVFGLLGIFAFFKKAAYSRLIHPDIIYIYLIMFFIHAKRDKYNLSLFYLIEFIKWSVFYGHDYLKDEFRHISALLEDVKVYIDKQLQYYHDHYLKKKDQSPSGDHAKYQTLEKISSIMKKIDEVISSLSSSSDSGTIIKNVWLDIFQGFPVVTDFLGKKRYLLTLSENRSNSGEISYDQRINVTDILKKFLANDKDESVTKDALEDTYKSRSARRLLLLSINLAGNLSSRDSEGRTLFYEICRHSDVNILSAIKDEFNRVFSNNESTVNKALKNLIDNTPSRRNWRPLLIAAEMNRIDIAFWLLKNGAEVNIYRKVKHSNYGSREENYLLIKSVYYDTPLYFAVVNINPDLVEMLIDYGAKTYWTINDNSNLFHLCLQLRNFYSMDQNKVSRCDKIFKLLYDNTPQQKLSVFFTNYYCRYSITLFHELVFSNHCGFVKELLTPPNDIHDFKDFNFDFLPYRCLTIDLFLMTSYKFYALQIARTREMLDILIPAYIAELKNYDPPFSNSLPAELRLAGFNGDVKILYKFIELDLQHFFKTSNIDFDINFQNKFIINRLLRLAASVAVEHYSKVVEVILKTDTLHMQVEYENIFYGYNPFYHAIYGGNSKTLGLMLAKYNEKTGAHFNLCFIEDNKWTPLMLIARRNYKSHPNTHTHLQLLRDLLASASKKVGTSGNANQQVISQEELQRKNLIIKSSSSFSTSFLDQLNKAGESAVYIALEHNNQDVAFELIDCGAQVFPLGGARSVLQVEKSSHSYKKDDFLSVISSLNSNRNIGFFAKLDFKNTMLLPMPRYVNSSLHLAAKYGSLKTFAKMVERLKETNYLYLLDMPVGYSRHTVLHEIVLSEVNVIEKLNLILPYVNISQLSASIRDVYDLIVCNTYFVNDEIKYQQIFQCLKQRGTPQESNDQIVNPSTL